MEPLDLKQGDLVVLRNGEVYQILHNPLAQTGLSLFCNQYHCLEHLDNYADNFDCINSHHFNIYKVICGGDPYSEDYKTVGQHFISGIRLSEPVMECIEWDWERDEDRPEFEKTNLKNGLIVTTRENRTYMVVLDVVVRGAHSNIIVSEQGYIPLSSYNEDLTNQVSNDKDIIKVEIFNDVTKPKDRYLIWQREEA